MADASRFPQLALPFAITGACAGWLSAGLVSNPLLGFRAHRGAAAACATTLAALVGAVLTRACVGRRYDYEIGDPDPELRPATDFWPLHALVVLAAGAACGTLLAALTPFCCTQVECTLGGAACALAFVPVCLAVVAAGRRAQRARLGSIVAASNRRAVWSILAMLLATATLEALPDWPASALLMMDRPFAVLAMLAGAAVCTLAVLLADVTARSRARRVIGSGLSAREPLDADPTEVVERGVPRLDLGLGSELSARVSRAAAAYRGREKTLALVRGTPGVALSALDRAVRRGKLGLGLIASVALAHAAASTGPARGVYGLLLCGPRHMEAELCAAASSLVNPRGLAPGSIEERGLDRKPYRP